MTGFEHTYLFIQMITFTLMLKEGKNIKVKRKIKKKIRKEQAINQTFSCDVLPDKRQKHNFTYHLASIFPVKQLTTFT